MGKIQFGRTIPTLLSQVERVVKCKGGRVAYVGV